MFNRKCCCDVEVNTKRTLRNNPNLDNWTVRNSSSQVTEILNPQIYETCECCSPKNEVTKTQTKIKWASPYNKPTSKYHQKCFNKKVKKLPRTQLKKQVPSQVCRNWSPNEKKPKFINECYCCSAPNKPLLPQKPDFSDLITNNQTESVFESESSYSLETLRTARDLLDYSPESKFLKKLRKEAQEVYDCKCRECRINKENAKLKFTDRRSHLEEAYKDFDDRQRYSMDGLCRDLHQCKNAPRPRSPSPRRNPKCISSKPGDYKYPSPRPDSHKYPSPRPCNPSPRPCNPSPRPCNPSPRPCNHKYPSPRPCNHIYPSPRPDHFKYPSPRPRNQRCPSPRKPNKDPVCPTSPLYPHAPKRTHPKSPTSKFDVHSYPLQSPLSENMHYVCNCAHCQSPRRPKSSDANSQTDFLDYRPLMSKKTPNSNQECNCPKCRSTSPNRRSENHDYEQNAPRDNQNSARSNKSNCSKINSIRNIRNENYFECHSTAHLNPSAIPSHQCVHKFELDDRLLPKPLNSDPFGVSRCTVCNKPMESNQITQNLSSYEVSKEGVNRPSSGTTLKYSYIAPRKINIGNKNDIIELKVPPSLLQDSKIVKFQKRMVPENTWALRYQRGVI